MRHRLRRIGQPPRQSGDFSHVYKDELLALQGDRGGRAILETYEDDLWQFAVPEGELAISIRETIGKRRKDS